MRLGVLGLAILCAGCASRPASHPPAVTAGWRIVLSSSPDAPRQLDPTQLSVRVTDRRGRPVTGAQITAQLAMPAMEMGRNEAALQEAATRSGTYTGSGRFTMPGDWQVTVQADKGTAHQSQSFPITVR